MGGSDGDVGLSGISLRVFADDVGQIGWIDVLADAGSLQPFAIDVIRKLGHRMLLHFLLLPVYQCQN
jgi:hypothetical protein